MFKNGMFLQNRYEIISKIGSGGMADVYKAKDHKLNRFIAVKVLKKEFREDKAFISKFRVEAQSAAGLAHPNIVNVYDVGEEAGVNYIVMELVEGITLKEYIGNKGHLSVREATSIALQISAGLEAAHNNGIIHRDVKPQNIIIATDGRVKVADFGIARAASANTINSGVMGSVHYSSPEQARGGYSDEKSDIYSLGITMYEMLTGEVPFDGDTAVAVAIRHLQEEIHGPKELVPEIPYSTNQIVVKCTQKSPDRRYPNMTELIRDLRESLVNPDGDFVTLSQPDRTSSTIIMTKDEVNQINAENRSMPSYDESIDVGAAAGLRNQENEPRQNRAYQPGSYYQKSQYQEVSPGRGDTYDGAYRNDGYDQVNRVPNQEYDPYYDAYDNPEDYAIPGGKKTGNYRLEESFAPKKEKYMWEDDHEVGLNPKLERAVTVGGIIVAVIIGCVFLSLLANALGLFNFAKRTKKPAEQAVTEQPLTERVTQEPQTERVTEPLQTETQTETETEPQTESFALSDLSNYEQSTAQAFLLTQGLQCQIDTTQYNAAVEKGHVISTDPEAGSMVKAGDTVTLFVSQGAPEDVQYVEPWDLYGYTQERATEALEMLGLIPNYEYEGSDTVGEGLVIRQSAPAGEQIARGSVVTLTISDGTPGTVPADDDNITVNNSSWQCDASLTQPTGFIGQPVRITLVQNGSESTVFEGETAFPYRLQVRGADGTETGTAYVYLLDPETGEVTSKIEYAGITFGRVN